MDIDSPIKASSAIAPTTQPSPPQLDSNMTPSQSHSEASASQTPSQPASTHSQQAVSESQASSTTPRTMETDNRPIVTTADVRERAPSVSASGSVSASVSTSASAADDGEHNDSTSSSSGASSGPASQASNGAQTDVRVVGADDSPDDMDRFLRRVEMEKKIAQLQQRLELASIKTNHGWSDMTIKEIETSPSRRPPIIIPNGTGPSYEPPSPSRPWQLADVLWQPLPPAGAPRGYPSRPSPLVSAHAPSHSLPGGLPSIASLGGPGRGHPPVSPNRQRMGMDEYLARPTLSPLRGYHLTGPNGQPMPNRSPGGHGGHRRASSSISSLQFLSTDPYPPPGSIPPRQRKTPKKRSQSQSNLRDRPTTQDVDAARALTFMLESGRSPVAPGRDPRRDHGPHSASAISPGSGWPSGGPPSQHFPPPLSPGLPSPFSDMPPPRPRAQSFMVTSDPYNNGGNFGPPHLPHPHPMPPAGFRPPSHLGHGRGTSIDSSTFGRSFWRSSPDKDRERERERDRERDREQRERERMREDEGVMARGEDDQQAAELMMFLAHSPSPLRPKRNSADVPSFNGTARVLFSDMPPRGGDRTAGTMGPPLSVRR